MAKVYGRKLVNGAAARAHETQTALRKVTREVEGRARANLATARATTRWHKIIGPEHQTYIEATQSTGQYGEIDHLVSMVADDAMAIELGHFPSGFFDPEKFGRMTKAPHGLYILARAAGLTGQTAISSGRNRGKR